MHMGLSMMIPKVLSWPRVVHCVPSVLLLDVRGHGWGCRSGGGEAEAFSLIFLSFSEHYSVPWMFFLSLNLFNVPFLSCP